MGIGSRYHVDKFELETEVTNMENLRNEMNYFCKFSRKEVTTIQVLIV